MEVDPPRVALLQQMAVFGGIRAEVVALLLAAARPVSVAEGDYFFRQDEQGEAMYVLETGRVAVIKETRRGPVLLRELGPGQCFGEMALMDMSLRSASVQATKPCEAIEIPMAALMQLYEKDIEQFVLIEMNLGREISRRLREADDRLVGGN